jgi:Subtilase family/Secretion system C-terminal sorting domain
MFRNASLALLIGLLAITVCSAEVVTQKSKLLELSKEYSLEWEAQRGPTFERLLSMTTGPMGEINKNPNIELIGIDDRGFPILEGFDNVNAARTTRTDRIQPGGIAGFNLTGSNSYWLAVWDQGVYRFHQEFGNRVTRGDGTTSNGYHGTHVAGTMIAAGVNPAARGMGNESSLKSYTSSNDDSEMAAAAAGVVKLSNHSYGPRAGWNRESGGTNWYWLGDVNISTTEDYAYGYYDNECRSWDQIAYNAPYYLMCRSAGNDRGDNGGTNAGHYVWINGSWSWSTDYREPDGGADGFDCINWGKVSKNILTCGSVADVLNYTGPQSVQSSSFSNWGPADDGRIKPDLVANGEGLFSTYDGSPTDYNSISGTSMSAPNITGTINLLMEYYYLTHSEFARSATMRGLVLHTTNECGSYDGPDYSYGWGLLNAEKAALTIQADSLDSISMQEHELDDQSIDSFIYDVSGEDSVRITLCWTDPPAQVLGAALNNRTPHIVNDLDLRLINNDTNETFFPYTLDPENPSDAPVMQDNLVDNVEQIYLPDLPTGTYRIEVSHKGSLTTANQPYSIICSGLIWTDDPRVAPSNLVGSIDFSSGEVSLSWELPEINDDFISFSIYRDGALITSTTDFTYSDTVDEFNNYVYTVSSLWEMGESLHNESVEVNYLPPVPPSHLVAEEVSSDLVLLSWELYRTNTIAYDDGTDEGQVGFNDNFESGTIAAKRMIATEDLTVTEISVHLTETMQHPFGEIRYLILDDADNSQPGEILYQSNIILPTEEGWNICDLGEGRLDFSSEEAFWIALEWVDIEGTYLSTDTNLPRAGDYMISLDGSSWESAETLYNGFFDGNPLLRAEYGTDQLVGEYGLEGFTVNRNGNPVAENITSFSAEVIFDSSDDNIYSVTAMFLQGSETSETINGITVGIEEDSELPLVFAINDIYPNPFNPSTTIVMSVPDRGILDVRVYNLLGKEVAVISSGFVNSGIKRFIFDGKNLASGVYFVRSSFEGYQSQLRKVLLVR